MTDGPDPMSAGVRAGVRVLVLDDHEVVRDGLIAMLEREADLAVVASARTAEEALSLHREHRPEVTLVDLRLPGMSGARFIATVRSEWPDARFVVLTTFDSDDDIFQAFRAGANAYVLKDSFRAEIVAAIRGVAAGRRMVPEPIAERLARIERAAALSPREVEVLTLVARGETNKEIARALGVREGTVKTHLLHIYEKLDVDDRTAAVTAALARGIIQL